jgi:hypothetical protein
MTGRASTGGRVAPARRRPALRARVVRNLITGLVWAVYLALGVVTAAAYGYLDIDRAAATPLASAVLAVLCWPAVFLGASLRL